MESFFEKVAEINSSVNGVVWGSFGLFLLIGTGILMTVCTKVFQITHIGLWWKNTIGSLFTKNVIGHSKEKGSISPFQALCTALAATVGTGNIAGVAAAICIGGAGAVFWMWVAAFFGMMTNYSENVLGLYYRRRNIKGEWSVGAMYYLRDGLGSKKGCKTIGKFLRLFSAYSQCLHLSASEAWVRSIKLLQTFRQLLMLKLFHRFRFSAAFRFITLFSE